MPNSVWDEIEDGFRDELALIGARFEVANPPPAKVDSATASIDRIRKYQDAHLAHMIGHGDALKDVRVAFFGMPAELQCAEQTFPLQVVGKGDDQRAEWRGRPVRFMEAIEVPIRTGARTNAAMSYAVLVSAAASGWTAFSKDCRSAGQALGANMRCRQFTLSLEHRRIVKRFHNPCSRWLAFLSLWQLERSLEKETKPLSVYWSNAALRVGHDPSVPSPDSVHKAVGWARMVEATPKMATGYLGMANLLQGLRTFSTTKPIPAYTPDMPWFFTIESSSGIVLDSILALTECGRKQGPDDLLNHEQAGKLAEVDAGTIRRWINDGELPCHGPKREVSRSKLIQLLPVIQKRKARTKRRSKP